MHARNPTVSVVMPIYNQERHAAEAISSILNQTYRDLELVIVDDGSTDRTPEVVQAFRDDRIRYVRQDNQGPGAARNTALRVAKGEFIAHIDSDDVAQPNRLARQLETLDGRKDRVIFTEAVTIGEDGKPCADSGYFAIVHRMANRPRLELLRHLFIDGNCFIAPTAFAARSVFESVGDYDVLLLQTQDRDMWTRLLLNGVVLQTICEPLLSYRKLAGQRNLSAATDATVARTFFEGKRLLRAYRRIASVAELMAVFPEVERFHYPLEDEFTLFYLALLGLHNEGMNRVTIFFGADLLLEIMADNAFRSRIAERLGFRLPDLFRILGTTDPWSRLPQRELQSALQAIEQSRSWRLTRPLRRLSALANRVRRRLAKG